MGKLYIGSPDDLHGLHNPVSLLLQPCLELFGDGEHGSRTEGIPRVHAQGINVLNEADGDHFPFRIPHHFQLQLLPSQDGLFHQDLAHQTGLEASGADCAQFFFIVYQTAPCASHGVGRPQHHRISQCLCNLQRFLHSVGHFAAGHLNAQGIHGFLKLNPVLSPLNGIHLNAYHLHLILLQDSRPCQFRTEVEPRLSAQIRQQRIRTLLGNNLLQTLLVQRLDIGHIRRLRICHDGGRIGIHQYDLIAQLLQRLTGLGAGIVKLTGLAYDDGPGTYDQNFVNISSLWHVSTS